MAVYDRISPKVRTAIRWVVLCFWIFPAVGVAARELPGAIQHLMASPDLAQLGVGAGHSVAFFLTISIGLSCFQYRRESSETRSIRLFLLKLGTFLLCAGLAVYVGSSVYFALGGATGLPVPVPSWVPWSVIVLLCAFMGPVIWAQHAIVRFELDEHA